MQALTSQITIYDDYDRNDLLNHRVTSGRGFKHHRELLHTDTESLCL
jgi:hypothetical protein